MRGVPCAIQVEATRVVAVVDPQRHGLDAGLVEQGRGVLGEGNGGFAEQLEAAGAGRSFAGVGGDILLHG